MRGMSEVGSIDISELSIGERSILTGCGKTEFVTSVTGYLDINAAQFDSVCPDEASDLRGHAWLRKNK
jgi:hypothetical protein